MKYPNRLIHAAFLKEAAPAIQHMPRFELGELRHIAFNAKCENQGAAAMLDSIQSLLSAGIPAALALQQAEKDLFAHQAHLDGLNKQIEAQEAFLDGLEAMTGHRHNGKE